MEQRTILEICLDSVESCVAAERGGAQRIELCANLAEDGTTPSAGLIAAARESIGIGLFAMIRPRAGNFCYSVAEFEVMKRDITFAKHLGADGVVFGVLKRDGQVDLERTRELAKLASPMSATFHRAFDMAEDPERSLETLIQSGIERVLTSGQARSAVEGTKMIRQLVEQGKGRIQIMAGAGITAENARDIRDKTGVGEIHVGAGASEREGERSSDSPFAVGLYRTVSARKVARIVEVLRNQ
jgi:copper homeostasis protein